MPGKRNAFARRTLLKTALGGVFLAPFLRERALEAQALLPKRLVLVFTPDSHPREWWPTAGGPHGFTLGGPLLDFVGLEQNLLFVQRIDHSWTFDNHHEAGMAQLFTGARFFDDVTRYADGPSIDQILLQNTDIRGGTPVSDIHLCAGDSGGGDKRHVISYSGPGQPIPHEPDPVRAFDHVFNGVTFGAGPAPTPTPTPADDLDAQIARRALTVNMDEIRRIQTFLGQEEKARLQIHLDSLSELEQQALANPPPTAGGAHCQKVDTSGVSRSDRDDVTIEKWAKVQADLIVNAFACDRTRIADFQMGFSGSHHTGMMGLVAGDNNSWHDTVAHLSVNDTQRHDTVQLRGGKSTAKDAFIEFDRLWARQVAYLTKKLAGIPEGDGTMLDNTLIYWGVESGTDHNHSPRDMQYLLIGGKNMGFKTGQFLKTATAESAHKLHTSVLHGLGYQGATGIGTEPMAGPLDGILV
jgi:hypothetical protein